MTYNYFNSSTVIPLHSTTTNTQLAPADWNGCNHITAWLIIRQHACFSSKAGIKGSCLWGSFYISQCYQCSLFAVACFEIASALCLIFSRVAMVEINPSSPLLQTTQTSHHETHYSCITATIIQIILYSAVFQFIFKSPVFEWQETKQYVWKWGNAEMKKNF